MVFFVPWPRCQTSRRPCRISPASRLCTSNVYGVYVIHDENVIYGLYVIYGVHVIYGVYGKYGEYVRVFFFAGLSGVVLALSCIGLRVDHGFFAELLSVRAEDVELVLASLHQQRSYILHMHFIHHISIIYNTSHIHYMQHIYAHPRPVESLSATGPCSDTIGMNQGSLGLTMASLPNFSASEQKKSNSSSLATGSPLYLQGYLAHKKTPNPLGPKARTHPPGTPLDP